MSDSTPTNSILTRGVATILPAPTGLAELMAERPITLYLGIDPTGAFLHLGHLVVLRKLQQFAEAGHRVILLIGNGTVKIGDPTGRDSSRPVLTEAEIEANFASWQDQASKVLDFSKIEIKRNGDWLDKLTFVDLVKLMAKTTVQQLIERDMFQDRIKKGQPIFGHEIIYPLLQGYDSVAMDVDLEIGGTDQTFNMLMGRQLQEAYHHHQKWVLTTPIINGLDGRKMSKSFHNFVALTDSANDMYGKLMSLADDQILEYFTLLTDVPDTEIIAMRKAMADGANPMEFKKHLALTITTQLHSPAAAATAAEHFQATIQDKVAPSDILIITTPAASATVLELVKLGTPELSNTEIRRLSEQGGVTLFEPPATADSAIDSAANSSPSVGRKLSDPTEIITLKSRATPITLKVGKKRWFQVKFATMPASQK
ncbi:MAG TPA: tyrosine--tRNA ligase [Candidatus Pacebacteria bacterium]|nr:tyrosine--tRNA ligase [Candidatus Paceibacterota bacterium]